MGGGQAKMRPAERRTVVAPLFLRRGLADFGLRSTKRCRAQHARRLFRSFADEHFWNFPGATSTGRDEENHAGLS